MRAANGVEHVEGMLRTGQLGVDHGLVTDRAQPLDERACLRHRHQRVVSTVNDEERRRVSAHLQQRRRALGDRGIGRLEESAGQEVAEPIATGTGAQRVGEVVHAVEGHAGLH